MNDQTKPNKSLNSISEDKKWIKTIIGIVLIGFLLRIAIVIWIPTVPVSDFWSYFERAKNLAESGYYSDNQIKPDAVYPPAYPILLSPLFHLPFNTLILIKVINCVLSSIGILLIGLISRKLFGKTIAIIATVLVSIYPRSLLMPVLIASENLFIPLLLFWIWILLNRKETTHTLRFALLGGTVLGLLSLTRSIAYFLWIFWPIAVLSRHIRIRSLILETLLVISIQHLVMSPWAIRNHRTLGQFTFLNSYSGINLFIGNNDNAHGSWYYWIEDMYSADSTFYDLDLMEQNKSAAKVALSWMKKHPLRVLELYFKKWQIIFQNNQDIVFFAIYGKKVYNPGVDVLPGHHFLNEREKVTYKVFNTTYFYLLFFEITGGLLWWFAIRKKAGEIKYQYLVLLMGTAVYFPAVSAFFLATPRFHWPTMTLLMPQGAITVYFIYSIFKILKKEPELLLHDQFGDR